MTEEELEKEAEKYADKQIGCGDGYYEWTDVEQAFKDGAEFGYNKANEWHYVKSEEDLPKDNSEYLLLLEHGIRVFGYYNGKWWESWKGDLSWQEVRAYFFVPVPELPKESE